MAGFIAVCVLSDHSGAEQRKFVISRGMEGEHAVQLLGKAFFSSDQADQSVYIVLY